jgi:hypothetical protein
MGNFFFSFETNEQDTDSNCSFKFYNNADKYTII